MFQHLLKLRYLAIAMVVLSVLHAIAFLVIGAKLAVTAYTHVIHGASDEMRPGS